VTHRLEERPAPPAPAAARAGARVEHSFVAFDTRQDRPRFLSRRYGAVLGGRVLDVGCDRAVLRPFCRPGDYVGIDLSPEADVRQDLMADARLPFAERAFDAVVCTDVLEHLENLHALFDELVRVTRAHLLVSLPNNWNSARRRLQRGKGAIAHYGLPLEKPPDRHRWFFSFCEAEEFLRGQAARHGLEIVELRALEKPRPAWLRWARRLRHADPGCYRNLYAHTLVCHYRRT
jgi:SAM-dependent methyltransferase